MYFNTTTANFETLKLLVTIPNTNIRRKRQKNPLYLIYVLDLNTDKFKLQT
jgi:hypothetical protein